MNYYRQKRGWRKSWGVGWHRDQKMEDEWLIKCTPREEAQLSISGRRLRIFSSYYKIFISTTFLWSSQGKDCKWNVETTSQKDTCTRIPHSWLLLSRYGSREGWAQQFKGTNVSTSVCLVGKNGYDSHPAAPALRPHCFLASRHTSSPVQMCRRSSPDSTSTPTPDQAQSLQLPRRAGQYCTKGDLRFTLKHVMSGGRWILVIALLKESCKNYL